MTDFPPYDPNCPTNAPSGFVNYESITFCADGSVVSKSGTGGTYRYNADGTVDKLVLKIEFPSDTMITELEKQIKENRELKKELEDLKVKKNFSLPFY